MEENVKVVKAETGIIKSKIQVTSLILIIVSIIADPEFSKLLGQIIPPEIFTKITGLLGIALFVFRKFYTGKIVIEGE